MYKFNNMFNMYGFISFIQYPSVFYGGVFLFINERRLNRWTFYNQMV